MQGQKLLLSSQSHHRKRSEKILEKSLKEIKSITTIFQVLLETKLPHERFLR